MTEPLTPSVGMCVLHLFFKLTPGTRRDQIEAAVSMDIVVDGQTVEVRAEAGYRDDEDSGRRVSADLTPNT